MARWRTGLYYVTVDIVLVGQYLYFARAQPVLLGKSLSYDDSIDDDSIDDDDDDDNAGSDGADADANDAECKRPKKKPTVAPARRSRTRSLVSTFVLAISMMLHLAGASPMGPASAPAPAPLPATFPAPAPPLARVAGELTLRDVGGVLSWLSTLLYLTSRLPQLLLNWRRRSTSGLAISLFAAAFCGNLFYSLSLLLNPLGHADYPPYGGGGLAGPDGSTSRDWWARTLPFFLGAAGVLAEDATVGWQWLLWGERAPAHAGLDLPAPGAEDEAEGADECCGVRTRWNRWWPWNGWFEDSDVEDAAHQQPLLGRRRCTTTTKTYGSGPSAPAYP